MVVYCYGLYVVVHPRYERGPARHMGEALGGSDVVNFRNVNVCTVSVCVHRFAAIVLAEVNAI